MIAIRTKEPFPSVSVVANGYAGMDKDDNISMFGDTVETILNLMKEMSDAGFDGQFAIHSGKSIYNHIKYRMWKIKDINIFTEYDIIDSIPSIAYWEIHETIDINIILITNDSSKYTISTRKLTIGS